MVLKKRFFILLALTLCLTFIMGSTVYAGQKYPNLVGDWNLTLNTLIYDGSDDFFSIMGGTMQIVGQNGRFFYGTLDVTSVPDGIEPPGAPVNFTGVIVQRKQIIISFTGGVSASGKLISRKKIRLSMFGAAGDDDNPLISAGIAKKM